MSAWSVQRQISYFLLVLIFFAGVGAALFVLTRPDPSCADGKRNQDETGIDCGGACEAVCRNEIFPLRVLWSRVMKVGADSYDSITLVENPNLNLAVDKLPYSIDFVDKNNLLITAKRGETFANPRESFIVFERLFKADVGEQIPVRATFNFLGEKLPWRRSTIEKPELDFASEVFVNLPRPTLRATVINRSLKDLANLEIKVVLFDEKENTLAGSATVIDTLGRGTSQDIVFTWPEPFIKEPTLKILYPHFDFSKIE